MKRRRANAAAPRRPVPNRARLLGSGARPGPVGAVAVPMLEKPSDGPEPPIESLVKSNVALWDVPLKTNVPTPVTVRTSNGLGAGAGPNIHDS